MEIVTIHTLTEEIVYEILLRLPVKSLMMFKCVSKTWLFSISSYAFATAHLKISTENNVDKFIFGSRTLPLDLYTCSIQSIAEGFNNSVVQVYPTNINNDLLYDRVGFRDCPFREPGDKIWLVGSCNGLVCLHLSPQVNILWNPVTRKSKILPDSGVDYSSYGRNYEMAHAFGYNEAQDDYKVVECFSVVESVSGAYVTQVKVYSLRTNTWNVLSNCPSGYIFPGRAPGQFLNGAIHWSLLDFDRPMEWVIVSHDLATDTFLEMPIPKLDDYYANVEVKTLQGCLALYREHSIYMDIWVMKEYGVKESWAQVFRIQIPPEFRDLRFVRPHPLYLWVDGKILMNYGSSLRIYDSKSSNPQAHYFDTDSVFGVVTHVESLISLTLDDEQINNP